MTTECHGNNKFTDIAVKGSKDSGGRPYNMGFIEHCRRWREHGDAYAYSHYSSYLLNECDNNAVYEELGKLIFGDFLAKKALALGSFFSVLEDVSCLTKAAKARGDMRQYGRSLRLHCELWERGASGVEIGVPVVLARHGQVREAVANAQSSQNVKDAFYDLLSVMNVVDDDDIESIRVVAEAMLECAKQMDNEGTRAHHVHRILYAVRLKNPDLALRMVPKCRVVADGMSDEFERLVCNLFLVQQVAPLDLNVAEDISRAVTGASFAGEEGDTLLALAAMGRGREPPAQRMERLERLLERAEKLGDARARLVTVSGLLMELFWEQPSMRGLRRWQDAVSLYLSGVKDDWLFGDDCPFCVTSDLLSPKPLTVNNASAPCQGEEEVGSVAGRKLLDAIRLVTDATTEDMGEFMEGLVSLLFGRLRKIENAGNRKKALETALGLLGHLATDLGNALGTGLLDRIESGLAAWQDRFEATLCTAGIATSWYELGSCKKGERALDACVRYVEQCQNRLAEIADGEEDRSRSGVLSSLRSLMRSVRETRKKLSGKYEETERDTIKKEQESLTLRLAGALDDIPMEHRLSAFQKVQCVFEVGEGDATLGLWIEPVACALADVDRDLALRIASEGWKCERLQVVSAVAKRVGKDEPCAALEIMDSFRTKSVSEKVAEDVIDLCVTLDGLDVPRNVWERLAERLIGLQWCEHRTIAANICAIRLTDWSTEAARAVAERELKTCACPDVPAARNLRAFLYLLDIVGGGSNDIEPVLAAWKGAEEGIGARTRAFVRKRVAPLVAVQDVSKAIRLLRAGDEFRDDLDALSQLIADLVTTGHGDTALAVAGRVDEIASEVEEEKQNQCIKRFFEDLSCDDRLGRFEEGVRLWEYLLEAARENLDEERFEEIEKLHIVFMAAVDPAWAISRWFEKHDGNENVAGLMARRAVRKDPQQAIASVSVLPGTPAKGAILSHMYQCLSELDDVRHLEVPSPFDVMHCMDSPEERGELFAAYITLKKDWDPQDLLRRIRGLPTPRERRKPLEAAVKQLGVEYGTEILEILTGSVKRHLRDLDDKEDTDEEMAAWAVLAGAVSIDEGLRLLKRVEDSFERQCAANTLLANWSSVEPQKVLDLCEGFDDYDKASFVKDVSRHVARCDADRARQLVEAFGDSLDEDDRKECFEAISDAVFEEKVRRSPDDAIDEVWGTCDRSDQAKQLRKFFEVFKEGVGCPIVRWERVLDIVVRWIDMAVAPSLDYEVIEAIMPYAPDEACRRIALKPESEEKAEAYIKLFDCVHSSADIHLLGLAIGGYQQRIAEAEDEEDRSMVTDRFLEHVHERLGEWNTETVNVLTPRLLPALSELAEKGEKRDEVILEIVRKLTLGDQGLVDNLLTMLDNVDQRRQARTIIAERAPAGVLEPMVCGGGSLTKSLHSGEGEAARILGRVLAEILHLPLALPRPEASPDLSVSCCVKAFELLMSSHVALRPIICNVGKPLIAEMISLLHRVVRHDGDAIAYLSLVQAKPEGMDADEAGKAIGKLLTDSAALDDELAQQDCQEIAKLITKGDSSRSLPPILGQEPALLQASEGCDFVGGLFAEVSEWPGKDLVEDCLAALVHSYGDTEDCLVDLSVMAEELRDANGEIRKLVSDKIVVLGETLAKNNDEAKPLIPMLRIFLASNLFLPEYPLDSIRWMRQGLKEFAEITAEHGVGRELFMCLTRLGYCLGRMIVLRQCDKDVLERKEEHIWHVLLGLAEFECQALITVADEAVKDDDTFKKTALSFCAELDSDLASLEGLLTGDWEAAVPEDARRRAELAQRLHSSLTQAVGTECNGEG